MGEFRDPAPCESAGHTIDFHIDQAGFGNQLVCGTINYFEGWAISRNGGPAIVDVVFDVGGHQLGTIPVRKDRPDLSKLSRNTVAGFAGVVDVPEHLVGQVLRVRVRCADQSLHQIGEYHLAEQLSLEEREFRRRHRLPDDLLMHLVVHDVNPRTFLEEGRTGVQLIETVCDRHGIDLSRAASVLDFGVGCGRIMRWWEHKYGAVKFVGADVNPALVAWCRVNLPFAEFAVNPSQPPTVFKDGQFDCIYAFSVFTHLTIETQRRWLSELRRILRPNGIAILSVHGENHARRLHPDIYDAFVRDGYLVLNKKAEGENMCATYQNRRFCEQLFSSCFVVREYIQEALHACGNQDVFILAPRVDMAPTPAVR